MPKYFCRGRCGLRYCPKIGSLGHMVAEVLANTIGKELGIIKKETKPMEFELLSMGGIKGFYMRTNQW